VWYVVCVCGVYGVVCGVCDVCGVWVCVCGVCGVCVCVSFGINGFHLWHAGDSCFLQTPLSFAMGPTDELRGHSEPFHISSEVW